MTHEILDGPKTVSLTTKLATEFAEMEPAPGDRALREYRLSALSQELKKGLFRSPEWASVFCEETQKTYRLNGKHTSTILAKLNGDLPDLKIFLTRFKCESLKDVAEMYATFDARISSRTTADVNRSFQMSDRMLCELPTRLISLCVSGIAYSLWEDAYTAHSSTERAELMFKYIDFVFFVKEILTNPDGHKFLRRAPVVAAMFKTWQKTQSGAKEFWTAVRDATGFPATSPDRKLNKFLMTHSVFTGSGAKTRRERAAAHEFFVRSLHAWNAWRKGSETDLKYYPNAKTPAAI